MINFLDKTGLTYFWGKIKSLLATGLSEKADKATTLSGYGITDAVTLSTTQTITGNKKFSNSKLEIDYGSFKYNYHIERRIGGFNNNVSYANWDSEKKNGTWHRIWRVSFPEGSDFWGKITIGFCGSYSSFDASGYMEKEICVAFNGSLLFNNVGRYSALGLNVEKDFRISELIWDSDTNQWQILIYSHQPRGNNIPQEVIIKCETAKNTAYTTAFEGITVTKNAEISQILSYVNPKATVDGTSKTFYFADLPVYQDPYGDEIAVIDDIPTKVSELTNDSGFTTNTGTITGITMNGVSKGTSGNVNLGTVLTEHQSLAGKQDVISDLTTIRSGASAGATAYQKPSTGIPKTDLASAVQTSLGKADTALQSHQDISGKADVAALAGYTPTANFATINGASITGGGDIIITAGSSSITTIDAVPTKNSTNPVQSGGVYDAIEGGFYY